MIDFTPYIGEYLVLVTNDFEDPQELSGIRNDSSKVFKYKGLYTLVRPVTREDLKDEDFLQFLTSMWKDDLNGLKFFLKYKTEYTGDHPQRAKKPTQ